MGNWNRHFVRVGSDGNVGIFSQSNDKFVYLDDTEKEFIITPAPNSSQAGYLGINRENTYLNRTINGLGEAGIRADLDGSMGIDVQGSNHIYMFYKNQSASGLSMYAKIPVYDNVGTSMNGIVAISGSPDLRTGVTAADTSAITIFSSTASGVRYEVKARILATSGTSATYKIVWTEDSVAQSVPLTITAVDTEVHDNFVIAPDAGTDITAQITSLTTSTVNVDAIVSVLG